MIPSTDFGTHKNHLYFLHANGYPPACYLPLIELLTGQYHVNAMHLRPLWPNTNPNEIRDWHPLSNDFLLHVQNQGLRQTIAVGHSVGAIVALRAAMRRPDAFRALVLVEPVLFLPGFIAGWRLTKALGLGRILHPFINNALKRRRKFEDLQKLFNSYRRKQVFRYFSDTALWAYIRGIVKPTPDHGFELIYTPEWEAQIYESGIWKDMDIWRILPTLKIPMLIIRGAETDTFSEKTANRIKSLRPATSIVTVQNSTHLVPLEKPQETYQIISDFLKELA